MLGEAGACQFGLPGVELASEVARLKDDILLRRYRLSAF